jgi:hypothetical protein
VEQRQVERRLWPLALALVGFLAGFAAGVLGAFVFNQTQSLGVLLYSGSHFYAPTRFRVCLAPSVKCQVLST